MSKGGFIVFLVVAVLFCGEALGVGLPVGASFMGLSSDDRNWYGYVVQKEGVKKVPGTKNAHEISYSRKNDSIYMISSDEKIYFLEIDKKNKREIVYSNGVQKVVGIRQGISSQGRAGFYAVSLIDGSSRKTELVFYDSHLKRFEKVMSPRLSIYDPHISNGKIVYVGLSCVEVCEQPIQELWIKSVDANNARQLSLFSSFIKHPFYDGKNEMVFFSFPDAASTSIWKFDVKNNLFSRVTEGRGVASNPVVHNGVLYFIEQSSSGSGVYSLEDSRVRKIGVGESVFKVRNLEIPYD